MVFVFLCHLSGKFSYAVFCADVKLAFPFYILRILGINRIIQNINIFIPNIFIISTKVILFKFIKYFKWKNLRVTSKLYTMPSGALSHGKVTHSGKDLGKGPD